MRITFITPSVSRAAGGIFEIERRLGQSLSEIPETTVSVYGLRDEHTESDLPSWSPVSPRTFPVVGPAGWGYSPALRRALAEERADVGHLHALWMFTSVAMRRWSVSKRRPYIVTPNGMLEPWALKNSAWKKRLASLLYERRMLAGAACLQANTEKEAADLRAFGLANPIAIIPNGVDLPDMRNTERGMRSAPWVGVIEPGRKVLLFLSRIHPKKGLVNLIKALAKIARPQSSDFCPASSHWALVIAGWDQGGHEAELKQLATELQVSWADIRNQPSTINRQPSILFLGPQFNEDKAACYANCDAFILPSFSEGLPMAVLEAWAYGKPVLMTQDCNLPEGFAANAAMKILPDPEHISRVLDAVFRLPSSDLHALGLRGRTLVAEKFSWHEVARQMRGVYNWVLGGGPQPNWITFK